jgi:hypothetical protein
MWYVLAFTGWLISNRREEQLAMPATSFQGVEKDL